MVMCPQLRKARAWQVHEAVGIQLPSRYEGYEEAKYSSDDGALALLVQPGIPSASMVNETTFDAPAVPSHELENSTDSDEDAHAAAATRLLADAL